LDEALRQLPQHDYIYLADSANAPYGEKSSDWIAVRSMFLCKYLANNGCDAIVIACNTATAEAIKHIRAELDIPIVGVEPGIKPAAMQTQNGIVGATFAVSLFNSSLTRLLNLEISAMEADGKGKIISSPRIVTTDQVKAMIEQGTELPYQTGGTATTAPSIEWRKASLKLEVTPQITPEGNIILTLDVNKDSVGRVTVNGFAIDTKRIQTQVLVENGGTVAIGGIFEQTERNDDTKVPLLGDLPIVGALFRSRIRSTSKSEMLVFITPQLLPEGLPTPVQALGTEGWPGFLTSP